MKKFAKFLLIVLASLFVIFACGSTMNMEVMRDGKGTLTLTVSKAKVQEVAPDRESFEEYFDGYVNAINKESGEIPALTVKKYKEDNDNYYVTVKTRRLSRIKGLGEIWYADTQSFLKNNNRAKDEIGYGYDGTLIPTLMKVNPDNTKTTYYTEYYQYSFERDENGEIKYQTKDGFEVDQDGNYVLDADGNKIPTQEFVLDENNKKIPFYKKPESKPIDNFYKIEAKNVATGEIEKRKSFENILSSTDKNNIIFFQMTGFAFADEITLELPGKVKYISATTDVETGEKLDAVSVDGKTVTLKPIKMNFVTKDKVYERELEGGGTTFDDSGYCEVNTFFGYFVYEQGVSPWLIAGIIGGVIGLGVFLFFAIFKGGFKRFFHSKVWKGMLRYKLLYLLILPGLALLILFRYLPMVWLSASFMDYDLLEGLGSEWIGIYHFKRVFFAWNTEEMYRIFRNTIFISLIRILSNLPVILFLAILINSIKNKQGRTVFQAISFIPYFLSWASVGGIFNALLDPNYGMLNRMLNLDINWYGKAEPWWAILSVSSLWKGMGWSTLIYISAMCNIDSELYEACALDGGGKLRQVFTVTLPGIMNIICLQLILDVSNIMRDNYEQILAMTNGRAGKQGEAILPMVDVVGRIAHSALGANNYGPATAIGMIQGVIGAALVLVTNKIVKKTENEGII